MKTKKATKVLRSKKPQTEATLMKAIKSLGSDPQKISVNLVKLGFEKGDQTNSESCPVCLYLKKLGFKSPYVSTNEIWVPGVGSVNLESDGFDGMGRFQKLAGAGKIVCMGGARVSELLGESAY